MTNQQLVKPKLKELRFGDEIFYLDQKYEKIVPYATKEEDERELESLRVEGQRNKIAINPQRVVLGGHRRIKLLYQLSIREETLPDDKVKPNKIKPNYEVRAFDHPLQEILFVMKDNSERRNMTVAQQILLAKRIVDTETELEKELVDLGKIKKSEKTKGKKSEKIAKKGPFSPRTVERVLSIEKNGTKEEKESIKNPEKSVSIDSVHNKIQSRQNVEKLQVLKLPEDIIGNKFIMDFGWKYGNNVTGGSQSSSANQKFVTKTIDKIIAEDVPSVKKMLAKDSVVFFWTTVPMFGDQLRVIEALGLQYKTKLFWIKENIENLKIDPKKGGWGYWYNGVVEECIVAVKGNVKAFHTPRNNIIFGRPDKRIHSKKPDAFVELVKESTKNMIKGDIIDLFGRTKIEGVKAIGNQIIKDGKVTPIPGAAA